jgi:hypothetical protein
LYGGKALDPIRDRELLNGKLFGHRSSSERKV